MQPSAAVFICHLSPQEVYGRGLDFKTRLSYTVRSCFKGETNKKKVEESKATHFEDKNSQNLSKRAMDNGRVEGTPLQLYFTYLKT